MESTLAHRATAKQHPSDSAAKKSAATLHCLTCGYAVTTALGARIAVALFGGHDCTPAPDPVQAEGVA